MSYIQVNARTAHYASEPHMTHLRTIKGTAMNKDRARVWLEVPQSDLIQYGFARGERINIELHADAIAVCLAPNGKRKVAGRERGGKTICILDICFDAAQRDRMFQGAAELNVTIEHGRIVFTAA